MLRYIPLFLSIIFLASCSTENPQSSIPTTGNSGAIISENSQSGKTTQVDHHFPDFSNISSSDILIRPEISDAS